MIHYHGTPITPMTASLAVLNGGHAFVSFKYPEQLGLALDVCQSFAVDNGAFSSWKSGKPVTDWTDYYEWVGSINRIPSFDFAVIPDVIDGGESDNDLLIAEWPWRVSAPHVGAPVWHMHESLERLLSLALEFPRICIGSSGQFATVGDAKWWTRMAEAMNTICDKSGLPICKLHGLRMLDPDVFKRLPFSSADSTNIAQNIGIDSKWRGTYLPPTKETRAMVMRQRIESHQAASYWDFHPTQMEIAACAHGLSTATTRCNPV